MAKRTKKTTETRELVKIGAAGISEVKERWSDGETVLFDCTVYDAVQLHGLTGRYNDRDEFWVAFPSRKGSDGKYYKHFYATFTDDALEMLEKALFPEE